MNHSILSMSSLLNQQILLNLYQQLQKHLQMSSFEPSLNSKISTLNILGSIQCQDGSSTAFTKHHKFFFRG